MLDLFTNMMYLKAFLVLKSFKPFPLDTLSEQNRNTRGNGKPDI